MVALFSAENQLKMLAGFNDFFHMYAKVVVVIVVIVKLLTFANGSDASTLDLQSSVLGSKPHI